MSKTKTTINNEFLNDVRNLVEAVRDYLNDDSGSDGEFITAMSEQVEKVERQLAQTAHQ